MKPIYHTVLLSGEILYNGDSLVDAVNEYNKYVKSDEPCRITRFQKNQWFVDYENYAYQKLKSFV